MNEMLEFINNNLFAIITAFIAIIALLQTHIQIKVSNKQFLFDKRLNKFLLTKSLLELFKENEILLDYSKSSDDEAIIVDMQFGCLTNIEYLKDITCIISDTKNNELKNSFLIKMEELKKLSCEVKFLFKNKNGLYLSKFISKYQKVLIELYKYQLIQNIIISDKIPRKSKPTYKELQKEYGELKHRYRLYNAIEELKQSYYIVMKNNAINKIEKLIKL